MSLLIQLTGTEWKLKRNLITKIVGKMKKKIKFTQIIQKTFISLGKFLHYQQRDVSQSDLNAFAASRK